MRTNRWEYDVVLYLVVFEDYLKRTADGAVGADELAQRAPPALIDRCRGHDVLHDTQGAAGTYADAEPATLAFLLVN
jgi:hypothetical protein